MRSILRLMAALMIFIGATLTVAGSASAVPTVSFTVDSVDLTVGQTATFTADAFCDVPPCRYQWRWYRVDGTDRLGTTMGEGPVLEFAFSTDGPKTVVLKVTNSNSTHGFGIASQVLMVTGDPVPVVDPPVVDPTPADPPVVDPTPADPPVVDPTPADPPVVDPTPADTPPADTPPADTPPADTPPVDTPPADTPPADTPPAVDPAPPVEAVPPAADPASPVESAPPTADPAPPVEAAPPAADPASPVESAPPTADPTPPTADPAATTEPEDEPGRHGGNDDPTE